MQNETKYLSIFFFSNSIFLKLNLFLNLTKILNKPKAKIDRLKTGIKLILFEPKRAKIDSNQKKGQGVLLKTAKLPHINILSFNTFVKDF